MGPNAHFSERPGPEPLDEDDLWLQRLANCNNPHLTDDSPPPSF